MITLFTIPYQQPGLPRMRDAAQDVDDLNCWVRGLPFSSTKLSSNKHPSELGSILLVSQKDMDPR